MPREVDTFRFSTARCLNDQGHGPVTRKNCHRLYRFLFGLENAEGPGAAILEDFPRPVGADKVVTFHTAPHAQCVPRIKGGGILYALLRT